MYMTAAYLNADSPWARRALVGAGQAFATLKQNDAAVIVYRKLLAINGVEPDLAEAARRGLRAPGRQLDHPHPALSLKGEGSRGPLSPLGRGLG